MVLLFITSSTMSPENRPKLLMLLTAVIALIQGLDGQPTQQPISCEQEGFFPLEGYCHDYYECKPWKGSNILQPEFLECPSGTVFDKQKGICQDPALLTSPPDCSAVPSSSTTTLPGATPTILSDAAGGTATALPSESGGSVPDIHRMIQEVVDVSSQSREHVCVIEKYVNFMASSRSLLDRRYESRCGQVLSRYSDAIENGQNIVGAWRRGNDILSGVKEIFSLAKKYETEFDRKYEINQERRKLSTSSSSSSQRIAGLQQDIERLEQDIKKVKETLQQAPPSLQSFLQDNLKSDEATLEEKKQELENALGSASAFSSLTNFLDLISRDAKRIDTKAKDSTAKVNSWHSTLSNFHASLGTKAKDLDECAMQINTNVGHSLDSINQTRNEINDLKDERATHESSIPSLDDKVSSNIAKMQNASDEFQIKVQEAKTKIRTRCKPVPLGQGTLIKIQILNQLIQILIPQVCDFLQGVDNRYDIEMERRQMLKEQRELQQLQENIQQENKNLLDQISVHSTRMSAIAEEIRLKETRIETLQSEIREAETMKAGVEAFLSHRQNVGEVWKSVEPAIVDLGNGLQKVDTTFHAIHSTIDAMVTQVKEAQSATGENKVDIQEVRDAMDLKLKELQSQIDLSSNTIQEIMNCP